MLPTYRNSETVLALIEQAFGAQDPSITTASLLKGIENLEEGSVSDWAQQLPDYLRLGIKERDGEQAFCVDFIIVSLEKNRSKQDFKNEQIFNDSQGEAIYYALRHLAEGYWKWIDIMAIQKEIIAYWIQYADQTAQRLVELINTSFNDIPKGRMTLYEAEAHDDYRDATEEEKKKENSKHWQEVRMEDIRACSTALSYLDPDSWHYYIPAYMCYRLRMLRGDDNIDPVFVLTESRHQDQMMRWRKLDNQASKAVYHFLDFMLDYEQMFLEDKKEIPAYWEQFK